MLTTAEIGANVDATGADSAPLEITDAKLFVPVVTWSAENNVKLVTIKQRIGKTCLLEQIQGNSQ